MKKIVTYDIANPGRLKKVAKLCELYGVRVERSVFECDLKEDVFNAFWQELQQIVNEEQDSVVAYSVCKACMNDTLTLGKVSRPEHKICYYAGF